MRSCILRFLALFCFVIQITRSYGYVNIESITPQYGLQTGGTRVVVRGGPFKGFQQRYKKPKCKFGNKASVYATYVRCTPQPFPPGDMDPELEDKTDICLQCDNSPSMDQAGYVSFSVSLSGDFSDSSNTLKYEYYPEPRITAISPRYGRKNGGTQVQIWGENFKNFGEYLRVTFGTKEVIGHYVNDSYLYCFTPDSEVVNNPMPVAVTLNDQQFSNTLSYWYYTAPSVSALEPNFGPDTGGTSILFRGNNFDPFYHKIIDNDNDTFCKFGTLGIFKAEVINSTKVICKSPPSFVLREVPVEVTLNNQEYTGNGVLFHYYRPPSAYAADPLAGSITGGTVVTIYGNNFENTETLKCKFGNKISKAKFLNPTMLQCESPKTEKAEYVPLQIAVHGDDYTGPDLFQFTYIDFPVIESIEPTCGPESGYTHITVKGKNFMDIGFDKAFCVFNKTLLMNATIFDSETLMCSSPRVLNLQGVNENKVQLYHLEVTINGKDSYGPAKAFHYYVEPSIKSVEPKGGPIQGNTTVIIKGVDFKPSCACNVTERLATMQVRPMELTDSEIKVQTPEVELGDDIVITHGINGQQYSSDIKLNYKDEENTYTYYNEPSVFSYSPRTAPSSGGTLVKFRGFGFRPFKDNEGSPITRPVWIRLKNPRGEYLSAKQCEYVDDHNIHYLTPKIPTEEAYEIEMSLNNQNFFPVENRKGENSNLTFFHGPNIASLNPPFGPITDVPSSVKVKGSRFKCINNNCATVACRFSKDELVLSTQATVVSESEIHCQIPRYNKPESLRVEITLDGVSYTTDGHEYGYFVPTVLRVTPRLISRKGNSPLTISGRGFSEPAKGQLKVKFGYDSNPLLCNGEECIFDATFINSTTIKTVSVPHSSITYKNTGAQIGNEPFPVEISVFGNHFTTNNYTIFYLTEPDYSNPIPNVAMGNGNETIIIPTDFYTKETNSNRPENSQDILRDYSEVKCRYTSSLGKIIITKGYISSYPLRKTENYNAVFCDSPVWTVPCNEEQVKLDVSINGGGDFKGNKTFYIKKGITLHRIYPTSGPITLNATLKIIGTGLKNIKDLVLKMGTENVIPLNTDKATTIVYSKNARFSDEDIEDADIKKSYDQLLDFEEGVEYDVITAVLPKLTENDKSRGGSVYITLAKATRFEVYNEEPYIIYKAFPADIEFHYYREPSVKRVHPKSGSVSGKTPIVLQGSRFEYFPKKGISPHFSIGTKKARCVFESTVRAVCYTPENTKYDEELAIRTSLNGKDFGKKDTTFQYYPIPIITDMQPKSGSTKGGTHLRLISSKKLFVNITDKSQFLCRFKPLDFKRPPRFVNATYVDAKTIICVVPGGWEAGTKASVDLTYNGVDFSNTGYNFKFYSIMSIEPRTGPTDGSGGFMYLKGAGFEQSSDVYVLLDGRKIKPVEIKSDSIQFQIPKCLRGEKFFGVVPLEASVNGDDIRKFTGGFHYYPQLNVTDFYPRTGPAIGKGVIKFYGSKFRADFEQANPKCKFGKYIGKAEVVSEEEFLCHIPEIKSINQTYTPEVSVNGYSFVKAASGNTFTPYGIYSVKPQQIPITGNTEITVFGAGFINSGSAKCRFGVKGNSLIMEARVLSKNKLICFSPSNFTVLEWIQAPFSLPFGVSFLDEKTSPAALQKYTVKSNSHKRRTKEVTYEPWTSGVNINIYKQPKLIRVEPNLWQAGKFRDVYLFSDPSTPFIESIQQINGREFRSTVKCSFGRFGMTPGVFINSSTVRCVTPNMADHEKDINEERIVVRLAMNGQDFTEESSSTGFHIKGSKASSSGLWPYFLGITLALLAVASLAICVSSIVSKLSISSKKEQLLSSMNQSLFDQSSSKPHISSKASKPMQTKV